METIVKADEATLRWREVLGERVRALIQKGQLTGLLLENTRRADNVLLLDFLARRFEVSVMPRARIAAHIRPDHDDRMLQEMAQGQPVLEPNEATAAWCFVTDETRPDKPSTHMRLRALRGASQGNA